MLRALLAALLLWAVAVWPQDDAAFPILIGRPVLLLPPAVDSAGRMVVFGSGISPEGATLATVDLYAAASDGSGLRRLTRLAGGPQAPQGATAVSLSANGSRAAFTAFLPNKGRGEEVHVVEVASGADRVVAVDTEGCIQPLAPACPNCFFYCINTPHVSLDGARVLYSARRNQPFYVVSADGTGLIRLPIYTGTLAPAPQRVISRTGQVVFTSSAPFGPTFAPAAQDVHLMNLDGSSVRAVTKFGNEASLYAINATVSADGATIVFESNRDPDSGKAGNRTHIWVVRSDGSGLRPLTFNVVCLSLDCPQPGGSSPSISGDGSLVAFVNGGRVWLTRSDGTGGRALTQFRTLSALDPAISEDGSRVIFTVGPSGGGRGAIYSVNTDGTNLRPVYAPRALNQYGITAAAVGASPSPGSLISAYGLNLAPDGIATAGGFPLPTALAGVSLLANGLAAPLLAVTPWQVNAQLPPELVEGPVAFQLRFADGAFSVASAAEVKSFAPAIFTVPSERVAQAAVFHANSGVLADPAHPATAGETLEIYGTGLGPTDPFVPAGTPAPASPLARTVALPEVLIGNLPAQVTFSGLTPGLVGVYQVNAVVPAGLRPGQQVVRWRVGDTDSASFGTITVR